MTSRLALSALCAATLCGGAREPAGATASVAVERKVFGHSVKRRPIQGAVFGTGSRTILILGGIHGDEPLSAPLTARFERYLAENPALSRGRRVVVVAAVNPDGVAARTRTNARGVDINRNFDTSDWSKPARKSRYFGGKAPESEPETQAVVNLIAEYRPASIVTVHQPFRMINYDGPALALARHMARANGYRVTSDIGYATPGSFGTYAGRERRIPTITLELGEGSLADAWRAHREALVAALDFVDRPETATATGSRETGAPGRSGPSGLRRQTPPPSARR